MGKQVRVRWRSLLTSLWWWWWWWWECAVLVMYLCNSCVSLCNLTVAVYSYFCCDWVVVLHSLWIQIIYCAQLFIVFFHNNILNLSNKLIFVLEKFKLNSWMISINQQNLLNHVLSECPKRFMQYWIELAETVR